MQDRPAHEPFAPLRIPSFRWFIVSMVSMTMATQIQAAAVAWQVYAATHDKLAIGLLGLAEALPFVAVALFGGHIADVYDRRRASVVGMLALVLGAVGLVVLARTETRMSGAALRTGIYTIIALGGVVRGLVQPARQALGAEIVPRELLPRAVALRTSSWQAAAVAGPAIAGLLLAAGGPQLAYAVEAVLLVVAAVSVLAIRSRPAVAAVRTAASMLSSLREGLAFIRGNSIILGAMTLDMLAVLFGGAVALLPVFAIDILKVGETGYGILRAAPAAGAVLMSIALVARPPFRHAGRSLLISVALFGACMIGFALSRWFLVSLVLLALSGAVDMVSVVIRSTLTQVLVPDRMLGRVAAINQIFVGSSNEIGAFESGAAARLLGTVPSVVVGGAITIIVVTGAAIAVPSLRRLRRIDTLRPAS